MRILYSITALIGALCLVGWMEGLGPPAPPPSIYPIEASVPEWISGEDGPVYVNSCTTTSINQRKHYFLTAAHCISDKSYIYRLMGDRISDVYVDIFNDLAIIYSPSLSAPAIPLSATPPQACNTECGIVVTGYPFGWFEPTTTFGTVAASRQMIGFIPGTERPMMVMQIVGGPGMSGSTVRNRDNEIVSVVQMAYGAIVSPMMLGVDWEALNQYRWYWQENE